MGKGGKGVKWGEGRGGKRSISLRINSLDQLAMTHVKAESDYFNVIYSISWV